MSETKNEKFHRLKESRLAKAFKAIEVLGNLSNQYTYDYSPEEAEHLVGEVQAAVDDFSDSFGVTRSSMPDSNWEDMQLVAPEPPVVDEPKDAPKEFKDGPLELTGDETLEMISTSGRQIDAAINAINDGDPEKAKDFLLNLMRS